MFSNNQGTVSLPVNIENAPPVELPRSKGCIGLGTWMNIAEFKDLKVTTPKGKVLFNPDFTKIDEKWGKIGKGEWTAKNGVLRQSAMAENVTMFMGDTSWSDITITLKARKISGDNGFQIYFQNKDTRERTRWDLGGYNNSVYLIEMGLFTESMKGQIDTGRWYDLKIEILGNSLKGYLDGKMIQQVSDENMIIKSIQVSASKDEKSGDIILKIVNSSSKAQKTQIDLKGITSLLGNANTIVLTSTSPLDENTLEEPIKVSPKTEILKVSGTSLTRVFPGNSLTVIRLATKK